MHLLNEASSSSAADVKTPTGWTVAPAVHTAVCNAAQWFGLQELGEVSICWGLLGDGAYGRVPPLVSCSPLMLPFLFFSFFFFAVIVFQPHKYAFYHQLPIPPGCTALVALYPPAQSGRAPLGLLQICHQWHLLTASRHHPHLCHLCFTPLGGSRLKWLSQKGCMGMKRWSTLLLHAHDSLAEHVMLVGNPFPMDTWRHCPVASSRCARCLPQADLSFFLSDV